MPRTQRTVRTQNHPPNLRQIRNAWLEDSKQLIQLLWATANSAVRTMRVVAFIPAPREVRSRPYLVA
jgi:hypothetical protein